MANRAYLRVWTEDFSESTLIKQLVRFLAAVPLAASEQQFFELMVQAIDATEPPVAEWDLRGQGFGAAEVAALAAQHLHADTTYTVEASWDLWQFDTERMKWERRPSALTITCHGPEFDEGAAAFTGNFVVDLGLEHLFTGHSGLLGGASASAAADQMQDSAEHTFLRWMSAEENRREYHQKTRENIQELMSWMGAIEEAVPVERMELWSEGEEDFAARLETIAAE